MVEPKKAIVDGITLLNIQLQRERQRRQSERERLQSRTEDDRCSLPERTTSTSSACNQARNPGSEACAAPRRRVRSPFLNCACLCRAVIADRLKALNQATAELEKKAAKRKAKKAAKSKVKKGSKRGGKSKSDNDADADAEADDTCEDLPLPQLFRLDCQESSTKLLCPPRSEKRESFQSKLPVLRTYRLSVSQDQQQKAEQKDQKEADGTASSSTMCERLQLTARKSGCEKPQFVCPPCPLPCPQPIPPPCPPPCSPPTPRSRIPSKRKSFEDTPGKRMKNINNQQKRTDTSYTCSCSTCNNKMSCCCVEDLEAIEEEHDPCEDLCSPYVETTVQARRPSSQPGPSCCPKSTCDTACDAKKDGTALAAEEDDPCGEFFDIMRDTMEDAVKKTLDSVFTQHFNCLMEKMDALCCQMERSECIISKVYTDLNDKISYYGERNAQQFQYLCVRMEHDRLFYQQQQEYFLKAVAKCPQSLDLCGSQSPSQQDETEATTMRCTIQKPQQKCGSDDKHNKSKTWECTLQMDDMGSMGCDQMQSAGGDDDDDKASEKSSRRAKSRSNQDMNRRRSDSAGTMDGKGLPVSKLPPKKK